MSSFNRLCVVLTVIGGSTFAFASETTSQQKLFQDQLAQPRVMGELVVKVQTVGRSVLTAEAAQKVIRSALSVKSLGMKVQTIRSFNTDTSLQTVRFADDRSLARAQSVLEAHPSIAYAEPNFIYSHMAIDPITASALPTDERFGDLWGMVNTGQSDKTGQVGTAGADINVAQVWDMGITGNRNVVVAVIDTGIDWTHPDLVDNLYTNKNEIAGNGIDDDANGFIDDIHGWNFEGHNADSADDHNHGTHCAGTIGGSANNGIGVAGVNWQVSMMPLKFLDAAGSGSLQGAVEAIQYATKMRVNVMSNSWGGGGFSRALQDAIVQAKDAGILFVAAAGNSASNNDSTPTYPASYNVDNVVSVAATDNRDTLAGFSCFGRSSVHVAAPGNWILSTVRGGGYDLYRGTSMATPHVAGVSALMIAAHPEWTYAEIKDRLIRSSDPIDNLRRKVASRGRVNAYNALMGVFPPSQEPPESAWETIEMVIESSHPYESSANLTFPIEVPGAKLIRVVFEKVDVEQSYDKVWLEDAKGQALDVLTGRTENFTTDYVAGSTANIRFTSDSSVNGWGFKVARVQVIR